MAFACVLRVSIDDGACSHFFFLRVGRPELGRSEFWLGEPTQADGGGVRRSAIYSADGAEKQVPEGGILCGRFGVWGTCGCLCFGLVPAYGRP